MFAMATVKRASPWSAVRSATSPGCKPRSLAVFWLISTTGPGVALRNAGFSRYIEAL